METDRVPTESLLPSCPLQLGWVRPKAGTQPKSHTRAMGTQSHHRDARDSALAQAGGKLKYSKVRCRYFNYYTKCSTQI